MTNRGEYEIKVNTTFCNQYIQQEVQLNDNRADTVKRIVNLQDAGIREALIKLG